jgi:hypothetical protein
VVCRQQPYKTASGSAAVPASPPSAPRSPSDRVDEPAEEGAAAASAGPAAGPLGALGRQWAELPAQYKLVFATSLSFVICNMDKVGAAVRLCTSKVPPRQPPPNRRPPAACCCPTVGAAVPGLVLSAHLLSPPPPPPCPGQHLGGHPGHEPRLWLVPHHLRPGPVLLLLRLPAQPDPGGLRRLPAGRPHSAARGRRAVERCAAAPPRRLAAACRLLAALWLVVRRRAAAQPLAPWAARGWVAASRRACAPVAQQRQLTCTPHPHPLPTPVQPPLRACRCWRAPCRACLCRAQRWAWARAWRPRRPPTLWLAPSRRSSARAPSASSLAACMWAPWSACWWPPRSSSALAGPRCSTSLEAWACCGRCGGSAWWPTCGFRTPSWQRP